MSKQFKAGDNLRCVRADGWSGITKGNIYVATAMEGPCVRLFKDDNGVSTAPYAYRFELVASEPFKVGDRVTPNLQCIAQGFTFGKPYTVNAISGKGLTKFLHFSADDKDNPFRFRPASEFDMYVEPSATQAESQPAAFKVGDKVRITKKYDGDGELFWCDRMDDYVGREGVVTEAPKGVKYRAIQVSVDDDAWWYLPESLELVPESPAYKVCAIVPKARPWPETYASLEEAREAIIKSGRRGVSYEIFPYTVAETVRLVETTTRALEAA